MKIRKAVFPVAGLGTRVLPATKAMPKEMLPLVDKPLVQNAIDEAREAGIEEFVFVTSRGKGVLEDHFDISPELNATLEARAKAKELALVKDTEISSGHLYFTRQHKPLGLGHAVWCAKQVIGREPFAILLPDDVVLSQRGCLAQMLDVYNEVGDALDELARRIGFRVAPGFGERVIFRELFLSGLTLFDLGSSAGGPPLAMSHVAGRQEARTLIDAILAGPPLRSTARAAS